MKAEIIKNEGNQIQLLLKDAKTSEVNALRRTILSDVPKMAISRVRFEMGMIEDNGESYESVNVLPDEVIAHRLAMLPIPTYYDRFCFPVEYLFWFEGAIGLVGEHELAGDFLQYDGIAKVGVAVGAAADMCQGAADFLDRVEIIDQAILAE